MDISLYIVILSFLLGIFCCHFFWTWYQSSKINQEIERLNSETVKAEFDMTGGVVYCRPFRLGRGQDGSKENLSGMSKIKIIQHNGYIEMFGTWDRNNKNQIDPFSFYVPTENVLPDNLIEFGKFFVDLGEKLNKKCDAA